MDSALYFHEKALQLSVEQNDSVSITFALTHIAEVYLKQKSFAEAETYFKKALAIREKRHDVYGITDSYLYLGNLYFEQKDYNNALLYYQKGE